MNRVDRIVLDPIRTYACTRTARTGVRVTLERVFRRFRCFGLFLKAKKCRFGMKQIDYVGRQISSQGISMSKEKIESVYCLTQLFRIGELFQKFRTVSYQYC